MAEERVTRKDLSEGFELKPLELTEWTCSECHHWIVASFPFWAPPMCRNLEHRPTVMNQGPSVRVQWDKRAPWEPARKESDGPIMTLPETAAEEVARD